MSHKNRKMLEEHKVQAFKELIVTNKVETEHILKSNKQFDIK